MKVLRIFCLYDRVSQTAAPPIFCRNEAEAIRSVERSFSSAYNSIPSFNHNDFSLNEIGDFDPESLKITPLDRPRDVYIDYVRKEDMHVKTSDN